MSDVKVCPTCATEYPLSERFCPRDGTALRSSNAQADLMGSVVAERYHVMKKLGEGGMGTVYLAEHVKMGRKSALKVMNPGMNQDPDAVARFNREAANASRLNHPNICAIYDFGETPDGLIYLAMEFIEGMALTDLIEKTGSLPPARAASILHQAADALAVAHDYGIVHRDLKPDNIMIAKGRDGSDTVKVVDFGIAKASSSDAQKVTKTGLVVGTPEYMSPEQLAGDKLDGRSDLYSLALVGFNMLTGTLPFPSKSAQEAMIMRLTDHPKRLDEMKPDVAWPEALQTVMDKALARDPEERYRSAAEFGRDFARVISEMPATVAAEGATQVIGAQAATVAVGAVPKTRVAGAAAPAPAPVTAKPVASGGGKGMLFGAGGVVIAAAAIGFYVMNSGSPTDTPAINPDSSVASAPVTSEPPPPAGSTEAPTQTKSPPVKPLSNEVTNPPADGGRTGGNTAPPPVVDADEAALDSLDNAKVSEDNATPIIRRTDALLNRVQGPRRGLLLFRRGEAKLALNDPEGGCADFAAAGSFIKAGSPYFRALRAYIDTVCGTN